MGRPRKTIDELIQSGTYRPSRHGLASGVRPATESQHRRRVAPLLAAGVKCRGCGQAFFPKSLSPKFCSKECKQASWKKFTAKCGRCGDDFTARDAGQKFCSQACGQQHREAATPSVEARCRLCDAVFARPVHRTQRLYCSANCRERVRRKKRSVYLRTADRLRKMRMSENGMEQVCPTTVFERDLWTCYLCNQPVNRNAVPWADDEPTMDHVVPLSKGGPHTYENVRCACRACNRAKGDKLEDGGG